MDEFAKSLKNLNLTQILTALITGLICFGISALVDYLLKRFLAKIPKIKEDEKIGHTIRKVVRTILAILAFMTVFEVAGIPTDVFMALISIFAIAISLAVQGLLTNIVSGTIVNVTRPYQVNDLIECGTIKGTVREVGIISTKIENVEGAIVTVPNKLLQTDTIINYSKQGRNLIMLDITTAYQHEPEEVRDALLDGVYKIPGIIHNPKPRVIVKTYGDYGITYNLRVWVPHKDMFDLKWAINESIYTSLKKRGIGIPYPRVEVEMEEVETAVKEKTPRIEAPKPRITATTQRSKTTPSKPGKQVRVKK